MKIEVKGIFKSVGPFTWDNIPSLSILTGLNGAGKSQLLELIRTKPEIVQTNDSCFRCKIKGTYKSFERDFKGKELK